MNKTIKSIGQDKTEFSLYMEIMQGMGALNTWVNTQASGFWHSRGGGDTWENDWANIGGGLRNFIS